VNVIMLLPAEAHSVKSSSKKDEKRGKIENGSHVVGLDFGVW
jgi:hypothetical protein